MSEPEPESNKEVAPQPVLDFTIHPSVSSFSTSSSITEAPKPYLSNYPGIQCKHTATGVLVFDRSCSSGPRLLLVQRSQSDSMPGLWEYPGGSCTSDDQSILHAAARELWEETGLELTGIGPQVGRPHFSLGRSGTLICKFNFLVEVKRNTDGGLDVKLNLAEHQRFVWVSDEEVRAKKVGDVDLKFTSKEVRHTMLEAFKAIAL